MTCNRYYIKKMLRRVHEENNVLTESGKKLQLSFKIFEKTFDEVKVFLKEKYNKNHFHACALYREIFKHGNTHLENVREFDKSQALKKSILDDLVFPSSDIDDIVTDEGVLKFRTVYNDGAKIESVVIPMSNYNTLCVSSQVGCRLNCRFCKTGQMGFRRNLSVQEIVLQVYNAIFVLKFKIRNIVFMGMGEPFDNQENVLQAIRVLNDQRGLDFAHRRITISTAGLPDGIHTLGQTGWKNINLAISLNASNNDIRSNLMPVNKKFPISQLINTLHNYPLKKNGFFLIEYIVVKGVNDSKKNASELASILSTLPVRLNLIPYNAMVSDEFCSPSDADIHMFASYLEDQNIFVRKRWRKGEGLRTGCGQLST